MEFTKKTNLTFLAILTIVICLSSCTPKPANVAWKSKYRDLSIEYAAPFKLLDPLDLPEATKVGVCNFENKNMFSIDIFKNQSPDRSPKDFYEDDKNVFLKMNANNKLFLEEDVKFHGEDYHKLVYLIYLEDAKRFMKMVRYIRVTNKEYIQVDINFTVTDSSAEQATIPEELMEFDKNVKIHSM